MKKESKNKVIIIGLDGGEPSIIDKLTEKELPNLYRLKREGSSGRLRSTIPAATAPAWSAFMTGKNPGNTGCIDFIQRVTNNYETTAVDTEMARKEGGIDLSVLTTQMSGSKRLWEVVSEAGMKVGVMHVPMTYPPLKVDGFMITGLGTPGTDSEFTYPKELRSKLLNEFGYKMHITELNVTDREDIALADLYATERKRKDVALKLMNTTEWDLFMVVFEGTDYIQHMFWKYMDPTHPQHDSEKAKKYGNAIYEYYQEVDKFIGELTAKIDENTTVFIMSDHGGASLKKYFYIHKFLKNLGFLTLKEKSKGSKTLARMGIQKDLIYSILIKSKLYKIIYKIPKFLRGMVPSNDYNISDFDWTKTKAFSISGWGMVYINLKGREPNGIVEPGEEYESLRDTIRHELLNLKDPDSGEAVVKEVLKKEEVYSGKYMDILPDLVCRIDNIECLEIIPSDNNNDSLFTTQNLKRSGTHAKDGIIFAKGNGIKGSYTINKAEIIDLMPTILYILGIPIPDDMDGSLLEEMFDKTYLYSHPPETVESSNEPQNRSNKEQQLSKDDEARIKERLKGLGYLN